jgi:hypothetical protein
VFKGVIDVIVSVVLPSIMPDPFVPAGMNVRRFGVALLVTVGSRLFWSRARLLLRLASLLLRLARLLLSRSGARRWSWTRMRRWTMSGNVSPANATHAATLAAAILRRRGKCKQHEREE